MLSPSDFNNAVPQFTNGSYASNPVNPQYIAEPSSEDYNRGTEPLQTLPAQWWNWFINKFTGRFNKVNIYVKNLFNELAQLLSLVSMSPDGTEGTPTVGQLKCMFQCEYPTYLKDTTALSCTYVPQTTMVNGHALCGNVTVTCVACAGANGSGTAFGTAAVCETVAGGSITYVDYSGTNGCRLTTSNFLAWWNGAYSSAGASNLHYFYGGEFGSAAACSASCFRASTWFPNCVCMDWFTGAADRPVMISTVSDTITGWTNATLGPSTCCKLTFNPYTGLLRIPGGGIADVTSTTCKVTFNFGAEGLNAPIWLAAWNGYELRATARNDLCVGCAGYATGAGELIYSTVSGSCIVKMCGTFGSNIVLCAINQNLIPVGVHVASAASAGSATSADTANSALQVWYGSAVFCIWCCSGAYWICNMCDFSAILTPLSTQIDSTYKRDALAGLMGAIFASGAKCCISSCSTYIGGWNTCVGGTRVY